MPWLTRGLPGRIALHTGLAEQSVHNLVSRYNRLGPDAVGGPGKGGRRRSYLSWDEEALFLESFRQAALTGQIATAAEIKWPWKDVSGKRSIRPRSIGCLNDMAGGSWCQDRSTWMPFRQSRRLLKKLPEIIAEKLEDRDPGDNRPVLLFAQDEGTLWPYQ